MCSVESTGGMEPPWKSSQTCVIVEPPLEMCWYTDQRSVKLQQTL